MSRPQTGALKNAKSLKLYYFNGRGRAEKTRLVLAAGKIKYEEVTISDWPAFKPKTPYKSLPVLEVDGKMLGQSTAIFRFAAVEAGLTGSDGWDDVVLDSIVDAATDMENAGVTLIFAQGQAKVDAEKKMFDQQLPQFLQIMEGYLQKSGSGWFSKKGMTWADIMVFCTLDSLREITGKDGCTGYPLVSKMVKNVASAPGIKEFLAKRPADGLLPKK